MICSASISASRARTVRARFAWATAPGSWASSALVSWRINRSPRSTFAPGSKAMCTTFPGSSAATVTPWTAVKEPTAVSGAPHHSAPAARREPREGGAGVRKPGAPGRDEADPGLLVLALGIEQRQITRSAQTKRLPGEVERGFSGRFGVRLRLERLRIRLQGAQRIGHVLKCEENGLAVLRLGLVVGGNGGTAPGGQLPAPEDRLEEAGPETPHGRPAAEQILFPRPLPPEAGGPGNPRGEV